MVSRDMLQKLFQARVLWIVEQLARLAELYDEYQNSLRPLAKVRTEAGCAFKQLLASLHAAPDGRVIYVKGAPERVLDMCATEASAGSAHPLDAAYWHARIDARPFRFSCAVGVCTLQWRCC